MRVRPVLSAAAIGYLFGTFPTADLVARRASSGTIDLRAQGSGNPGAANALKVLGKKAGAAVMVGDISKGALASGIGGLVAGPAGAHIAGTASVYGHCFPVWNGFRGGKGVAAGIGQCLATFPAYLPIDLALAGAVAVTPALKQRAFTAAMISSSAWVVGAMVWWRKGRSNLWGPKPGPGLAAAAALSSAAIAFKFVVAREPD
jgi:glycerol-3-phosphate acyltransferase PlsY